MGHASSTAPIAGAPTTPMQLVEHLKHLLDIAQVNHTLSTAMGSEYVNDFVNQGQVQKVIVQGDAPDRMLPEDILQWRVRNRAGEMVPFSAFATLEWDMGSPNLSRYNGVPAMKLGGQAAPGVSSGEAMAEMGNSNMRHAAACFG